MRHINFDKLLFLSEIVHLLQQHKTV